MSDFMITSRTDWTPKLIQEIYNEIEKIALEEMELDIYPNSIEIISAEQMLDAYSSLGLSVNYNHWSFGKDFLKNSQAYSKGRKGLALEIVVNTNPCISYLMEENDAVTQTMVIAHAAFGHNAVFKNNECFKQWTNAGSIIDYMIFARNYIKQCEERYGDEEVTEVLDAAHAIAPHGIDKFKRKYHPKLTEETRLKKLLADEENRQHELDIIMKKTSFKEVDLEDTDEEDHNDEENLLYFIMKNAPNLPQWKREVIRIVYKINQYFYPQSAQTKNLNEGFASFTHYYIMTRLEEKGILSPDAFLEFLHCHTTVIHQPSYNSGYYGINPYALGFAIFQDIKRICENPTKEDKEWFPELIGKRWQDAVKEAAFEYRDDGFVSQFLSPKVIRDFRMFSVKLSFENDDSAAYVSEIHDEIGYKNIRNSLANLLERINIIPQIMVVSADLDDTRTLKLKYVPYNNRELDIEDADLVIEYIDSLWGYSVELDC